MNIAVILAGGSGSRLGNDQPKQFLKVAGKKVIEHTIKVFEDANNIDEICIVSRIDYINEVENIVINNGYKKVKKILAGGKERYDSSLAAINAYTNDDDNLLFHDAVRPLLTERIIDDCITALKQYNAVDVAVKTTDTIIQVNADHCIDNIPNRNELCNGQTPQGFKRGTIAKAYQLALQDPNFKTTDDCGTVRKYLPNEPIYVVNGENFNMKLTYVEDLFLLDKLFQLKSLHGQQDELTELAKKQLRSKVVIVFGGSYGIGGEIVNIIKSFGGSVYSFSRSENGVDVSKKDQVQKALLSVYNAEGRIDAVINTAGVLIKEALSSMSDQSIQTSIDVNLFAIASS